MERKIELIEDVEDLGAASTKRSARRAASSNSG
jgi:hypothetical protein